MPNDHIAQRKDQFITARHLLKLIGVNTALLWAGMATADVRDGTYFAFIQLHDYSAVAIDSRVTTGNSSRDDMCKLFPLSEHAIFFSAGVYEGADSEGTIIFSPHATAEQVFGGSNGRSMSEIAAHWARIIVEQIKGFYPSNHQIIEHNEDGFITRGVFAGESTNEGIVAYQSTIVRSDSSEKLDLGVSTEKIPNSFFLGLGHPEVVEPILHNGPDEWARHIHDQILAETAGKTGHPEEAAAWVSAIAQAVIDRAGNRNIGGQVASIILERGHNWRWFRRPDFCPKY
jgi:hypothetical protein